MSDGHLNYFEVVLSTTRVCYVSSRVLGFFLSLFCKSLIGQLLCARRAVHAYKICCPLWPFPQSGWLPCELVMEMTGMAALPWSNSLDD